MFWFELQRLRIVGELDGNEGEAPPSAEAQDLGGEGGLKERRRQDGNGFLSSSRRHSSS